MVTRAGLDAVPKRNFSVPAGNEPQFLSCLANRLVSILHELSQVLMTEVLNLSLYISSAYEIGFGCKCYREANIPLHTNFWGL